MPFPAIIGAVGGAFKAAGAALGGTGTYAAAGAAIGVASGEVSKLTASMAAITFHAQYAAQGVTSLANAIVTLPIKALSTAIGLVQAPVVAVVDALKGFVGAVGAVGTAISEFVKLSNPVYVQKFNMAMEDLMASIGKILTPILITSTAFVRAFADVIFKVSGPLSMLMAAFFDPLTKMLPEIVNAMTPLITIFSEFITITASVLTPLLKAVLPIVTQITVGLSALLGLVSVPVIVNLIVGAIGLLVTALATITVVFGPLLAALAALGWVVQKTFGYIANALGLKMEGTAGGSVGAAVRPAQIGSVEDYGKRAQQAAFTLGLASETPAAKTANYLQEIKEYLTNGMWKELEKALHELARWIIDGAENLIPKGPSIDGIAKHGASVARGLGAEGAGAGFVDTIGGFVEGLTGLRRD